MKAAVRSLLLFAAILWVSCHSASDDEGIRACKGSDVRPHAGRGALLLTRLHSYDQFREIVEIDYTSGDNGLFPFVKKKPSVRLTHCSGGRAVTSILSVGIHEGDFIKARDGGFFRRLAIVFKSPFAVINRNALQQIEILGRRRPNLFGEGDFAFYDIAETMVFHICQADTDHLSMKDRSEKGYLNTFNHVTAQALMTSLYSERIADFVADVHERLHRPELITGQFREEQIADLEEGAVDNYLDLINNEWGQELGKKLKRKYLITEHTVWTPGLLTSYLNDIQNYCTEAFGIGFRPFREEHELVIRFADKINHVKANVSQFTRYYH